MHSFLESTIVSHLELVYVQFPRLDVCLQEQDANTSFQALVLIRQFCTLGIRNDIRITAKMKILFRAR